MKRVLKVVLWVIAVLVLLVALFFGYLTIREYRPDAVESIAVQGSNTGNMVKSGETIRIVSWNIGYGGLGKDSDFVMDGGGNAPAPDKAKVNTYLNGIKNTIDELDADIYMLQEVDANSSRTYSQDERELLRRGNSSFALNYSCDFVPYPIPPIGKINSGIFTTSAYDIESADRYSLPCPFSWPLRIANLKRCLSASYFPIEGSDKKLVVVNLHLEAYDSGEGKIAQTKQLLEFVQSEFEKGNYIVAGGDWNQTFPGSLDVYPNTHLENWEVGLVDVDMLPEGWNVAYDTSSPTCRLLNQPFDPSDEINTQYYVIDGFICSPNVQIDSVNTINKMFENSDHNPVEINVTLLPEN